MEMHLVPDAGIVHDPPFESAVFNFKLMMRLI